MKKKKTKITHIPKKQLGSVLNKQIKSLKKSIDAYDDAINKHLDNKRYAQASLLINNKQIYCSKLEEVLKNANKKRANR